MSPHRLWLDQFEPDRQGAVSNFFYQSVREHPEEENPNRLCQAVCRGIGDRPGYRDVLMAMRDDPDGARAFALWVRARENMAPEARQQQRQESEADGKRRYMESKPATQKQLDLLLRLGVDEFPENRWVASQLIEAHKDW